MGANSFQSLGVVIGIKFLCQHTVNHVVFICTIKRSQKVRTNVATMCTCRHASKRPSTRASPHTHSHTHTHTCMDTYENTYQGWRPAIPTPRCRNVGPVGRSIPYCSGSTTRWVCAKHRSYRIWEQRSTYVCLLTEKHPGRTRACKTITHNFPESGLYVPWWKRSFVPALTQPVLSRPNTPYAALS